MKRMVAAFALVTICPLLSAAQSTSTPPTIASLILENAQRDLPSSLRIDTHEIQGKTQRRFTVQFNPDEAPTRQWSLVSINGEAATAADIDRMAKTLSRKKPPRNYRDVLKYIGVNPVLTDQLDGGIIIQQDNLLDGAVIVNGEDLSSKFRATTHVRPGARKFVDWVEFREKGKFKVGMATLESAFGRIEYDGQEDTTSPRVVRSSIDVKLSLPFGSTRISRIESYKYFTTPRS